MTRSPPFLSQERSLVLLETSAIDYNITQAPIAQLDRVLGYEPRGQEFESLWAHQSLIEVGTCLR